MPTESNDPLRPRLHALEEQLAESIEEVCDAPAPTELDTGELIRVEETLAIAAEAAKEAISLRRKMHQDRDAAEEQRATLADRGQREEPAPGNDAGKPRPTDSSSSKGSPPASA